MRPVGLLLRTAGGCDIDPERLFDAFAEQRKRFVAVLEGFGPGDWAAPTRCADWSAQDVVRHLCDANAIIAGTAAHSLDVAAGFDPRTTPREWLRASSRESPRDTLGRFMEARTTEPAFLREIEERPHPRRTGRGLRVAQGSAKKTLIPWRERRR